MKPTRRTLLLSIYISTSLHVSCNYVTIIRRIFSTYVTQVFFTLYGWLSGWLAGTDQPTRQPKYQCRIDTVSSPDGGHIVARNMQRCWNKYTKKQCVPSWFHLKKIIQGCTVSKTKQKSYFNTISLSLSPFFFLLYATRTQHFRIPY